MKNFLNGIKIGIWTGVFCIFIFVSGVFAYQYVSYVDVPDVSSGQVFTKDIFNQVLANVRDINTRYNSQIKMPIGSIVAWHKNLSGVSSIPSGWVGCNGQVLSDASSLLNGRTIPDLNNSPSGYNGGRFLRGGATSGVMQEGTSTRHQDWFLSQNLTQYNDGLYNPGSTQHYNALSGPKVDPGNANDYVFMRPVNMTVYWIMRVK